MEPTVDDRWHASGSYSGEAGYVGGRDYYRVAFVDNKPFHGSFEQFGRDLLSGEFGGLMTEILVIDPRSRHRVGSLGGLPGTPHGGAPLCR